MNDGKNTNWVVVFWVIFMAGITLLQVAAKLWHQIDWPMWACYWPMLLVIFLVIMSTFIFRSPKE